MSIFEPRTETVHIYGGDYHYRLEQLQRRVIEASESIDGPVARMGSKPENVKLAEEYDALAAEASAHRVEVTLRQLGRKQAKALRKAHPPRVAGKAGATERDENNDAVIGVNEETFGEALVRASVVSPELNDDDFDEMSEGAFVVLYRTALDLSYGFVTDPKGTSLASQMTRTNDETSS